MRCTPLAVFTAGVNNQSDIKKAILSEVKMTHPNKLVQEAVYIYQCTIHYLLNNLNKKDRAQQAFNQALKLSEGLTTLPDLVKAPQSVKIWL